MVFVNFADADEKEIVSVFGAPQDPHYHKHLGQVDEDDDRLVEFYASLPESILRVI